MKYLLTLIFGSVLTACGPLTVTPLAAFKELNNAYAEAAVPKLLQVSTVNCRAFFPKGYILIKKKGTYKIVAAAPLHFTVGTQSLGTSTTVIFSTSADNTLVDLRCTQYTSEVGVAVYGYSSTVSSFQ